MEGGAYGRPLPDMEQIPSAAIAQAMNDPEVLARNNPLGWMRSPMRRLDLDDDDNQETYPNPSWVWTDPQPAEPLGTGGINSRGAVIPTGGFCGFFRIRRHKQKINDVPASDSDSEDTCTICFQRKKSIVMNPCGHELCAECNAKWSGTCPMCRKPITSTRRKIRSKARITLGKLKRIVLC
ncbi:unnamed protein product [Bemisia tabaci]|uniref:RING-type domain-containing protein n=1 Tax=Bemisia tabaci TaxID=7038 RepID=A0A9P0CCS9_BEMTA|nr:unnamed protein product [Bemisia tabaci]